MRNIWILVKNYINCGIGSILGKKKRAKNSIGLTVIIVLLIALMILIGLSAWGTGFIYNESGLTKLLLYEGLLLSLMILIILSFQKITGGQRARDAELLLAMPISKTEIVVAKALSKYLFNVGLFFVFFAPYLIMYIWFAGFSIGVLLGGIVVLLLLPLSAVGLTYLVDYLTVVLFSKSSVGNILKALFTIAVLIGFIIPYMTMSSTATAYDGSIAPDVFINQIINKIPPLAWLVKFITSWDIIALVLIFAITILPFALGTTLFATTFNRQNQVTRGKSIDVAAQPNRGVVTSVFRNELNRYLNTPVWIINTFMGTILIVGVIIWLVIDKGAAVFSLASSVGLPSEAAPLSIAILLCMSSALTFASCSSISLEGKNLWILKTMPINTRQMFLGKVILNILLVTPFIIIGSIVLWLTLGLSVWQFLLILIMPISINVFISFIGLLINLIYPKLDWESENAAVKQSMATMITTLIGMAVVIVPVIGIVIALTSGLWSITLLSVVILAVYIVIAALAVVLTMTKGKKLFEKL